MAKFIELTYIEGPKREPVLVNVDQIHRIFTRPMGGSLIDMDGGVIFPVVESYEKVKYLADVADVFWAADRYEELSKGDARD